MQGRRETSMPEPLRVLAVATYPELAAATRYRILQYLPFLREDGIEMDVRPFLTDRTFAGLYDRGKVIRTAFGVLAGLVRRASDAARLDEYQAVFVQREAALVGPPVFERLVHARLPMVLDLDDSTYIDRKSEVFGVVASVLKWRGKTDSLIRWSDHAVCGNSTIAAYAAGLGTPTSVQPSIVDLGLFRPRGERPPGELVIGWMGSHSTFPYLQTLLPTLRRLAETHRFRLRVIGAGAGVSSISGLEGEVAPWTMESEVADLQSFDIGLYPIIADEWGAGKSGLKAIQYLSCGIPYVASPVGVVGELGVPGITHLEARCEDEWRESLARLLDDADLRAAMSRRARAYAEEHFSVRQAASSLATVLRSVVANREQKKSNRR